MPEIIAELSSVLGTIALVVSFQIKKPKIMFAVQCLANVLFCANYLLCSEWTASALMVLGMLTPLFLIITKKKHQFVKYAIMLIYLFVGIFTYSSLIDAFLCVAQLSYIIAQWTYKPRLIRWVRLAASPFWLIKNIEVGIFITVAEIFTFVSIAVFLIRTRKDNQLNNTGFEN